MAESEREKAVREFMSTPRMIDGTLFDPDKGYAVYGFQSYFPENEDATERYNDYKRSVPNVR